MRLYFLDMKIEIEYTKQTECKIFEYFSQGWSRTATPEFMSLKSILSNKNRDPASRKTAGKKISHTAKLKRESGEYVYKKRTHEQRKKIRIRQPEEYLVLVFNKITLEFSMIDFLNIEEPWIKCFAHCNGSYRVYDANGKHRLINPEVTILPDGYYYINPKRRKEVLVFDIDTREAYAILETDITTSHNRIIIPRSYRFALIDSNTGKRVYWSKELREKYGIPINYK